MIKRILTFVGLSLTATSLFSQTTGTLTFTFTTIAHSGYSGTKNVLAVWIQTSTGQFVKTKLRYAGGGTSDHLPTWATNSGGSSGNCLSASCNTTGATTGSTLAGATTKTITWDGTNASGAQMPDGTYKVAIQDTWNHNGGTATRYITFVKGPSADIQSPAADANLTGMSLAWNPASSAGIEEASISTGVKIYPNPSSTGVFNVEFDAADKIKVVNVLGVTVLEEKISTGENKHIVDLSRLNNGVYFISLIDGNKTSEHRIVVNK